MGNASSAAEEVFPTLEALPSLWGTAWPECGCGESFHTKYELGRLLGKGSQGKVHLCVHKETGAVRAVKVSDRMAKTAAWVTYKREVELSQSACGSNVVAVLEEFTDRSCCYMVMEKFEGHLRKGMKWVAKECAGKKAAGLGDGVLRSILGQALKGIEHLHEADIVHRDVKAHNLLIDRLDIRDPSCRVVLGDLGLARRLKHGRLLSSQVGTRKYWAPELYEKRYWHVVDVFALGVLLFLAICSVYPFYDEEQTRKRDVFAEGAVPVDGLRSAAVDFMRRCLEKDPSQRPTAAQLAKHHWFSDEDSEIVDAPRLFGPKADFRRGHLRLADAVTGDLCTGLEEEGTTLLLGRGFEDPSEDVSPRGIPSETKDASTSRALFIGSGKLQSSAASS